MSNNDLSTSQRSDILDLGFKSTKKDDIIKSGFMTPVTRESSLANFSKKH